MRLAPSQKSSDLKSRIALLREQVGIPASALYFKRQLKGSPAKLSVFPGETNATTTSISGEGLVRCAAMEQVRA